MQSRRIGMNREGYSDKTAELAIGNMGKRDKKPKNTKCEEQFGFVFKKLREIIRNQNRIIRNQEAIIRLLNHKG